MTSKVASICGIGERAQELLEVVGYADLESLAQCEPEALLAELTKANEILGLMHKVPARSTVQQWIRAAARQCGAETTAVPLEASRSAEMPRLPTIPCPPVTAAALPAEMPWVNHEADPVVVEMLQNAPLALPFPAQEFVRRGLGVADIPPGILLTHAAGDLEIRVDVRPSKAAEPREARPRAVVGPSAPVKRGIDITKLRSVTDMQSPEVVAAAATREGSAKRAHHERIERLRTPRAETNRGKDPSSRRYVRGVLHPERWRVRIGAFVVVCCIVLLITSIPAAFMLLFSAIDSKRFGWVPWWFLVFPLLLPVFGLMHLLVGTRVKCRVCGQRFFVPKRCHRHAKAHHWPVIGYILPTSLHLLLFDWFRCIFCGTPVRLKE